MPPKARRRPSKKVAAVECVKLAVNETVPTLVVQHFAALPWDNIREDSTDVLDGQPSKRRKLMAEPFPAICVATANTRFTRRVKRGDHTDVVRSSNNANKLLKITVSEPGSLLVASHPKSPAGLFSVLFSLKPEEEDGKLALILGVQGAKNKQEGPGDIWVETALTFTCQGGLMTFDMSLRLYWNETPSPCDSFPSARERRMTSRLIGNFWPNTDHSNKSVSSPAHFYEAAYVPSPDDNTLDIHVPGLESTLFPYQKRTLQWLLAREGVMWSRDEATLQPLSPKRRSPSMDCFRTVQDVNGKEVFVSDLFQIVTRDRKMYQRADEVVKGGILAEEMGLGKTLEILSLVLLHRRPNLKTGVSNGTGGNGVYSTGATLIITPRSLLEQWTSEIARHAPGLRVKHYKGCNNMPDEDDEATAEDLCGYDVVITTYFVLSEELHYAYEPPKRSRRYERVYRRRKSPLIMISWWRICLDEAQMIENGYGHAAWVVRVLPRINAWGITGTPVKNNVTDLFGLLDILDYVPYVSAPQVWLDLLAKHKPLFRQLFGSIALRHTKSLVRNEIMLPPQKRYAISMPFTAIEEQHYQSLFKDMAEQCGLHVDGTPKTDDWNPEQYEAAMRTWLNRLRQTTLHPEVGMHSRRLLGYHKSKPIQTVDEVLTAMLVHSGNSIRAEERVYLLTRLTRGQLYENGPRVKEAMALWVEVRRDTEKLVLNAKKKLMDAIRESGREQAVGIACDPGLEGGEEEKSDDESESKGKIGEYRRRHRSALELHHRAVFFCANAAFQIKENKEMTDPGSEEFQRLKEMEDEGYGTAKLLRQEILRECHDKATRFMDTIRRKASQQSFAEIPELVGNPRKGIESGLLVSNLEVLYEQLNAHANVIDEWREEVVQLLLRPLVDEDDEAAGSDTDAATDQAEGTGEELGDSAKFQDLLMVYVTTLRAAIADRHDAITGQINELAKHETQTSLRLAAAGDGPAPEKMFEMLKLRAKMDPKMPTVSMRAAVTELRSLQSRLSPDAAPGSRDALEAQIASDQLQSIQAQMSKQKKAVSALESEIEGFKATMNARLDYYRQLQAVSDAVLPYDGPKTDEVIDELRQTENELREKLSSAESKHRYLLNLRDAGSKSNEPRMCVICQMPFVLGVLTVCGHQFCKECITLWFKSRHNCPVCKKGLKSSNLHNIAIKPQELQVRSEETTTVQSRREMEPLSSSSTAPTTGIYSEFDAKQLAEIQNIDLDGPSYTTKIDMLIRHLSWLRVSDPGAKCIVFSQYQDFLQILRNAFRRFCIRHASIDDPRGIAKFKEDADVQVFLLHARAHSSGLNLVNASHVFLCEPLLNTALELQAIARVDRIGQQRETTVWLYLVSGTVEESVCNLSVQRRMKHLGKRQGLSSHADQANTTQKTRKSRKATKATAATSDILNASFEAANTLELEHASLSKLMSKDKSAGEMVDKNDLWECLFGTAARAAGNAKHHKGDEAAGKMQEKAVMNYLAGEAAAARVDTAKRPRRTCTGLT
ncbi:hypothetical protein E4U60_005715 [Claviceps pazoutovae]|uniref:Uncharacterized protein n=1 Tax=Claviceps pazoutovae TaxID=1649127 RepID=A0A9P7SF06_9HYPO|nr:hypothetical protein E4U60_005715 [Claviceps pazoutovae]